MNPGSPLIRDHLDTLPCVVVIGKEEKIQDLIGRLGKAPDWRAFTGSLMSPRTPMVLVENFDEILDPDSSLDETDWRPTGDRLETDWRRIWMGLMAQRAGFKDPSRWVREMERGTAGESVAFVLTGLDGILIGPSYRRAIRGLLQGVPFLLRAQSTHRVGCIIATSLDVAREGIRMNLGQFRDLYREYEP